MKKFHKHRRSIAFQSALLQIYAMMVFSLIIAAFYYFIMILYLLGWLPYVAGIVILFILIYLFNYFFVLPRKNLHINEDDYDNLS